MECVNEVFPIVLYTLGTILLIVLIVLCIKAIGTLNKVNRTMDDINEKSHKLDNLFTVVDNAADMIANVSDKAVGFVVNGITGFFHKINKRKGESDENEE